VSLVGDSRLKGVYAVVTTPYTSTGEEDEEAVKAISRRSEEAGIHVLTALGNTSEVQRLDPHERRQAMRSVASDATSALLVLGLEGPATEILALAQEAESIGYHAFMLHEPPDPLAGSGGMLRYFLDLADDLPLPVVLYVRRPTLNLQDLAEAASHPSVLAVKFARSDHEEAFPVIDAAGAVPVYGGAEGGLGAASRSGYRSFTSGIANSHPHVSLRIWELLNSEDFERLDQELDRVVEFERIRQADGGRHNVAAVKQACASLGLGRTSVRAPHEALDEATTERVLAIVRSWGSTAEKSSATTSRGGH